MVKRTRAQKWMCDFVRGKYHLNAPVAQRIERLASNQEVVGSNPAGGTKFENIGEILFIFKTIVGGSPQEADKESLPAVGRPPGAPQKYGRNTIRIYSDLPHFVFYQFRFRIFILSRIFVSPSF